MHWTTDKPTQPGYYWLDGTRLGATIVMIQATDGVMFTMDAFGEKWLLSQMEGARWAGPIEEPSESSEGSWAKETELRDRDRMAPLEEAHKEIVSDIFVKWWNDTYPSEAVPEFVVSNGHGESQ